MPKRVKNRGLIACKTPNGISVRTKDRGAEVCVSRHDNTLTIAVYHDGDDTPTTFELPMRKARPAPSAIWLDDEIVRPVDPGVRRSLYDMLCEHRPDLEIVEFECNADAIMRRA
jgi:hypothetical protein